MGDVWKRKYSKAARQWNNTILDFKWPFFWVYNYSSTSTFMAQLLELKVKYKAHSEKEISLVFSALLILYCDWERFWAEAICCLIRWQQRVPTSGSEQSFPNKWVPPASEWRNLRSGTKCVEHLSGLCSTVKTNPGAKFSTESKQVCLGLTTGWDF